MKEGEVTIGELAKRHNCTLRALRFYEQKGLLKPRRDGTVRYYGPAEQRAMEIIKPLLDAGVPIKDCKAIRAMREDGRELDGRTRALNVLQAVDIEAGRRLLNIQAAREMWRGMGG